MVVMEFGLLSGFVVDSNKVETPKTAKRTEVNDGNVVVYYDQVRATQWFNSFPVGFV